MSPIERAARALCVRRGANPDALEPGNTPYSDDREVVDGEIRGGPAFYVWRLYVADARAVLQAIREPSEAMVLAAKWEMVSEVRLTPETPAKAWRKMIDAALSEGRG